MTATALRRVLVADDNEDIRRDLARLLGRAPRRASLGARAARLFPAQTFEARIDVEGGTAPFDVEVTSSGDEALARARAARAEGRPFGVAFVDVRMPPGIDGARVARVLRDEDPEVELVLITAYADRTLAELNAGARGCDRLLFLKKPYAREEVYQLALSLSEKREARRELREARGRLHAILEATRDGLVGLDRDHRVVFANPAARELLRLGHDAEGSAGLWSRLAACEPRAVPGTGSIELRLEGRWLELGDVSPAVGDGTVASVIAVRDVTSRKDVERLKDEFVQNTSHELRTPLVAIRGYLDLALEERLGELAAPLRRGLDVARRASARLLDLIDALLELTRLEAQAGAAGSALERGPVDLALVVDRVVDVVRPAAEAKGLELHVELDPAACRVQGDERTLEVALRNLIGNAIKFTARGAVGVRARLADERVRVEVWDTGVGLPPGVDPRVLFERFRQGDGTISRQHGGVGIGLSLVERILALHGATVAASDRPEGGASFSFGLELAAPGQVAPPARASQLAPGRSVLVVEREREVRDFIELALRAAGHHVRAAATLEEALEGERDTVWSLAIVGEEDGARAARLLAERAPAGTATPVLALLTDRDSTPRAVSRAGPEPWVLEKPVGVQLAIALASAAAAGGRPGERNGPSKESA